MATLVLGTVGTLLGGPVGGALGALAGRQLDSTIMGSPSFEGPRLSELAVSSSSYGQPIPRHFGAVRAPGVIFWATDLVESKETSGGGKGKPKTTSYSYTVSLAVALSSTPIESVGRIWADGNLLRGAAGDLKSAGTIRVYNGTGDQLPDPLIEAAQATDVPAMRGCAYVVFEDLGLGDFGNRVPALSFEIFEKEEGVIDLGDISGFASSNSSFVGLSGYSDTGGPLVSTLRTLDQVKPITCTLNGGNLSISLHATPSAAPIPLPEPLGSQRETSGLPDNGPKVRRGLVTPRNVAGLRYYDRDRDYQISVQRAASATDNSGARILEFPATTSAAEARSLSTTLSKRDRWQAERLSLNIAELDIDLSAGKFVSIPDMPGIWQIAAWEWLDRGIELELVRSAPITALSSPAEPGAFVPPTDFMAQATRLWAIELPPIDLTKNQAGSYFAALTGDLGWTGASLFSEVDGGLVSLDLSSRESATVGSLVSDLPPSAATHIERSASIEIEVIGQGEGFQSATVGAIASAANRLYLGGEIMQFAQAEQISNTRWKLSGLLRGRAGTEHLANETHSAGAVAILIDDSLIAIESDPDLPISAIGLGDSEPATTSIEQTGVARAPLSPVHVRTRVLANGNLSIRWERRARGAWKWPDQVDVPMVEELESYIVGFGSVENPNASWTTSSREFSFTQAEMSLLANSFGPAPLWVKQAGTFDQSPATFIANIQ